MTREVEENTHLKLLTACGLKNFDGQGNMNPLPEEVVARYWPIKRCADRMGCQLTDFELARIAADCGYGDAVPPDVWSLANQWGKTIGANDFCVVKRGKKRIKGIVMSYRHGGDSATVMLDNEARERQVKIDDIEKYDEKEFAPVLAGV